MVKNRLSQEDAQKSGWLLDGYPRSAEQAEAIQEAGIKPDVFILIDVCFPSPHLLVITSGVKDKLLALLFVPSTHKSYFAYTTGQGSGAAAKNNFQAHCELACKLPEVNADEGAGVGKRCP